MRCNASWRNGAWGGVFVSSPAYADGYVDGTGNNIYYGYKTDASYTEARFHIEVDYYDTLDHAIDGGTEGKDPLGKFVRVHYLSNCKKEGGTADDWRFRPMWWFGVPKGLQNVQNITYTRVEKMTNVRGNQQFVPAGSSQFTFTDTNGYGVASKKTYPTPKQWKGISNFYFDEQNVLASKGWKQLLGLNGGKYDNTGNTESQWGDYQKETDGLQGIFVDWESAGQRFYDMTYVGEMTKAAWENRDANPLRFAAGVYRFAGNWHYAVGQKHNTPKIADYLKLAYPAVTKVKDTEKLTGDEQTAVKEKIEKANANTKYYSDLVEKVEVSEKGVATITFKDNTTRTMPASLLVTKDETDKDKYKPTLPTRTPVVNLNKLTPDEKTKIRQAIIDANGKETPNDFLKHIKKDSTGGYDFKVADNGDVSVEYQDGSKITIPASELVFQGPKISDWAPYVVPDPIEVENLSSLTEQEKTQIVNAFDAANTGITPYDEAKNKNADKKAPVTVDSNTGDATITWADGSTTTIAAWQFLKERPKTTPSPEPPAPTPTAEKEFIVEAPKTQLNVNFDPFNASQKDITDNQTQLNALKDAIKKCAAKDAKDNNTSVTIKDVEFKIVEGKGVVVFHADDYKDATYPMSVFLKQKANKQTPTPDTTLHHPGQMTAYNYYVDPVEVDNVNSPSPQDQIAAFKKFIQKNYTNVNESELAAGLYSLKENNTPVSGVTNMQRYVLGQNNGAGVVSFSLNADGTIAVQGFETGENSSRKLFDVPLTDLYVKKNSPQPQKDNTIEDLKKQAKALLTQKRDTDKLSNNDLTRAGIKDADQLNNDKIDGMSEKDLRDLIRKLTDAKKADYKYNTNPYEVSDPTAQQNDNDFQAAVKQFLKANYDDSSATEKIDNLTFTANTATLTGKGWTPKAGTSCLELKSDSATYGITTVSINGDGKSVDFKNGDTVLFTVPADKLYKKKDATPTPNPNPDENKLKEMKKQAKEMIERNPNLTDEQKKQYEKQVEDATDESGVKKALSDANNKGKENAKSTDPNTKKTITDNKGGNNAKEKKEKEEREKDKKDKENQQLQTDKTNASNEIDKLNNLSDEEKKALKKEINGGGTSGDPQGATTPEAVKKILDKAKAIDGAKGALKDGALPFLDHGTGAEGKTDTTHADDAALNELLGGTPAKDQTLTDLETALKATDATADSINKALDAAKRQNAINEENAKNAGIAKLDALLQQLTDAENGLNETQKEAVKQKVEAAKTAINGAKTSIKDAKKPSDIKTAVDGVKIDDALKEINTQVTNAQKTNASDPSQTQNGKLDEEKQKAKERVNATNLSQEEKDKFNKQIDDSKKSGDPTAIANRAEKAQKIEDALKKIDEFKHLNDKQKEAFKKIIEDTDAGNHKDDDGNDTGVDDIDDALANAANTDNAMARLEDLKVIADKFAKSDKYKGLQDGDDKKKAFDDAATAAGAVLDRDKGDAKGAAEVNDIYADLLKAMQALDNTVKGAGVKTDALAAEIGSDKGLKPSETDPKTPGDSVYTTASADKKKAFDDALTAAEQALKTANDDNANYKKEGATPRTPEQEAKAQKAVDEALDKLIKARLALDGVNTKPLEQQIAKDADIKKSVEYTKASDSKKKAYDDALDAAQKIIDKLTGKKDASADDHLDTKENKQKALDAALKALSDAAEALDGKDTTPVPPSDDDNPGSGSESDSGSGTSTSTGGGVNKQNLINQINTTENPGGANSGSGAAGTNPSAPGAGAQGAGMGAVTPGSGAGAAGTGAAGAASAGVDNKAVNNAVENAPEVKQADAAVKQAAATLDEALAQAKRVAADPHATQAQVDAAAAKLADARKALADAQANAAKVRAAVRSRVIKGMRSRGNAGIATGANVATTGLIATMIAAIGGAFATRRMRTKHANRD
ncbi:GA module-containing protein [Gardnerella piotii]|uniref:GA module-containing protein n=1 Tax=Gardnerella piotii TaxID=2792977 RepID=UPI000E2EAD2F|nr:GA module-containing protein [Gardnerella piotii]